MLPDFIKECMDKISQLAYDLQKRLKNFLDSIFSDTILKEFFPNLEEKVSLPGSVAKEGKEKILKMTDDAQASLNDVFEGFATTKLKSFYDEEQGNFANLIHPLEKECFDKLKKSDVLKFVLNLMGSTHANLTTFAEIPDRSFIVTEKTFPRLHKLYWEAHETLKLDKEYNLFCRMDYSRNAKTFGSDEDCLIVIDSSCLEDFSDKQILALLGRELAHIKFKHINYLTAFELIDSILNFVPVPKFLAGTINATAMSAVKGLLLDWLLAAQFSADRAGAFVAGSTLPVIQNNLMICGLETAPENDDYKLYTQIELPQDIDSFDQATKLIMTATLREFPIPFVITRIKELAKWGASDDCKKNFPEIFNASLKNNTAVLLKGHRFELTKNNPQLNNVVVEFNWAETTADIEHGAFLLKENGKVAEDTDFIFYNNPAHSSGSVVCLPHEKNSARIKIELNKIPEAVKKISLVLMICDDEKYGQNFSMIGNVILKLSDGREELAMFSLEEFTIENVIVFGELYRNKGKWKFNAIGSGFSEGLAALCKNFGVDVE